MATRIKGALRFYIYGAVIGLSAFVLALVGGRKSDDSQGVAGIQSASADLPAGTCTWYDFGGEAGPEWGRYDSSEGRWVRCPGSGSGDGGDCDGGGDCGE